MLGAGCNIHSNTPSGTLGSDSLFGEYCRVAAVDLLALLVVKKPHPRAIGNNSLTE
jgi:hypothetical protein